MCVALRCSFCVLSVVVISHAPNLRFAGRSVNRQAAALEMRGAHLGPRADGTYFPIGGDGSPGV